MSSPASSSPLSAGKLALFAIANIALSAITSYLVVRALLPPQSSSPLALAAPAATAAATSAVAPAGTVQVTDPANSRANGNPEATTAAAMGTTEPQATVDAANAAGAAPTPTLSEAAAASNSSTSIRISAVVFAGQLSRESVVIVNEGDQIDMNGWTISTPRGKTYTFGKVTLFKSSFVSLHSTSGADVPTDLFWNQTEPAWQPGDEVKLSKGDQVIATFTVK